METLTEALRSATEQRERSMPPLRIMTKDEENILCAPYELCGFDQASIRLESPHIGKVSIVDRGGSFKRVLFISESPEMIVVSMAGYVFDGEVHVYPWKDTSEYAKPTEDLDQRLIVRKINGIITHRQDPVKALLAQQERIEK